MRIAVRYEGGDEPVPVGGDWYISDPLPAGDLLLAVGHVSGTGVASAAMMVQLRYTTTALAVAGYEPSGILAALNGLLYRRGEAAAATAVVARYRPRTRQLTWARAGQLPIVLANRYRVGPLWQPAGVTLGVFPRARYGHATRNLRGGDMLLMYTDGFVDERGCGIDDGVRRISDQARRAYESPSTDRPAALVGGLSRRTPRYDACVLAAESLP